MFNIKTKIMSSTATKRVMQKTGSYTNDAGEKKNTYIEIGVVFESEEGYESMKFNALPLANKDGEVWMNLFAIEKNPKAKSK
tara:strand:- start:280 stop:525 length:246 start_codon:yes stop_codon:yes gene_type:complete